jgi:carbon monoxide dehydrogenase subunit G
MINMPELVFETTIARPRAEVWEQLRDLRVARHYVPGVTAIEYNSSQRDGVGTSRKVFMKKRAPVDETAVVWEDGSGFTLKIHNGDEPPAPFKWATFQYEIRDAPGGHTAVRFAFAYEMAMGLFGRILDKLIVRRSIERSNVAVAANMKKYYETGQPANPAAG